MSASQKCYFTHTATELSPVENLQQTSGDSADNKTDDIPVKEKGGYVMLGSERPTPTSSIGSSNAKGI